MKTDIRLCAIFSLPIHQAIHLLPQTMPLQQLNILTLNQRHLHQVVAQS